MHILHGTAAGLQTKVTLVSSTVVPGVTAYCMSGATLRQYTDIGKWRSVHYLALGGLNYLPIDYFLQQHPQVKNVVLCFDRDEPGLRFADTVARRLAERGFNVEKRLPAVGKAAGGEP